MDIYKVAGMVFGIEACFDGYRELCREYLFKSRDAVPEFIITVSQDDVALEKELYSYPCDDDTACISRIYRLLCRQALMRGGFFLHCAAIEYKNKAYLFLAPSGTGKSTHISLWRKLFGDEVNIINGDKPLIMPGEDGTFYAYGTPWSGKEGWQRNVGVSMGAVCILKRGENNSIVPIDSFLAAQYILRQTIVYSDREGLEVLLSSVNAFLDSGVECYMLKCNMDIEAAATSFEGMTGIDCSEYVKNYKERQEII